MSVVPGQIYEHSQTGAIIMLPAFRVGDRIYEHHLVAARTHGDFRMPTKEQITQKFKRFAQGPGVFDLDEWDTLEAAMQGDVHAFMQRVEADWFAVLFDVYLHPPDTSEAFGVFTLAALNVCFRKRPSLVLDVLAHLLLDEHKNKIVRLLGEAKGLPNEIATIVLSFLGLAQTIVPWSPEEREALRETLVRMFFKSNSSGGEQEPPLPPAQNRLH